MRRTDTPTSTDEHMVWADPRASSKGSVQAACDQPITKDDHALQVEPCLPFKKCVKVRRHLGWPVGQPKNVTNARRRAPHLLRPSFEDGLTTWVADDATTARV